MTTTRRVDERDASESAARRPRPKVDRPLPFPAPLNVAPRWPAFAAARITSPTKVFGRLAPRLPWRMRPGLAVKSSSALVMARAVLAEPEDGARSFDLLGILTENASTVAWPAGENPQSNQQHAPRRRRRFYLAVRWSVCRSPSRRRSNRRHSPLEHERTSRPSSPRAPTRQRNEQAVRRGREASPVGDATVI